jgi:high-affinity nickel-transport protein
MCLVSDGASQVARPGQRGDVGAGRVIAVSHDKAHLTDLTTGAIAAINMDQVGFYIVGLFVAVWAAALVDWRFVAERESPDTAS